MVRNEIGSEFWEVPVVKANHGYFPEYTHWYLSGRCALQAIISDWGGKSVALPSWLCESMILPFVQAGVAVEFYSAFAPIENIRTEAILVMDYFGYCRPLELKGYGGKVIRDVTHSVFAKAYRDADYYFGSLRKWAAFPTGGFAWTADGHALCMANGDDGGYARLRRRAMEEKSAYMQGTRNDKGFLQVFAAAEELLEQCSALPATAEDIEQAKRLDVEQIKERRRENAACLLQSVSDWVLFPSVEKDDCPLFVPVLVPGGRRDTLRQELIRQEIYCPVHWPLSPWHNIAAEDREIYDQELSLVCDQRYTLRDMQRMVQVIDAFRAR